MRGAPFADTSACTDFIVNISSDAQKLEKQVWDQESECRESDGIVRRADSSFAPSASARAVTVLPVLSLQVMRVNADPEAKVAGGSDH